MRREITVCDRCNEEVEGRPVDLRIRSSERDSKLELCDACGREVRALLRAPRAALRNGSGRHPTELVALELAEEQLERVRRLAADRLAEWNVGDVNPDGLAEALRDVASAARRPAVAA